MIKNGSTVSIHYSLSIEGQFIGSSEGSQPLTYIQGSTQIIEGLQEHLEGMAVGDETKVSIPAEKAYGNRDPEAIQTLSKNDFEGPEALSAGMTVQGKNLQGQPFSAIVTNIGEDEITLDFNHPLAGKTLDFEVQVVGVEAES